jgi:hypothetical protein
MARAAGNARYVFLMTANGVIRETWFPAATGALQALPAGLAPFEPIKEHTLVLSGIEASAAKAVGGNTHHAGMATFLGCAGATRVSGSQGGGAGSDSITIDQHLAQQIGGETKLRSIEAVVNDRGEDPLRRMSWLGAGLWVHPEKVPQKIFDRVFGGTEPSAQQDTLGDQRKSVLDFALGEYTRFASEVGSIDRERIDLHLTSLRALEQEFARGAGLVGCGRPLLEGDALNLEDIRAATRQHLDVLAAALACDATRVTSLFWEGAQSDLGHSWLGATGAHHGLSHKDQDPVAKEALTNIRAFYSSEISAFAQKLAAAPDVGGSVLDSTLIVWGSDVAVGQHDQDNMPFLLVGGRGLGVGSGRHIDVGTRSTNDLFTAVLKAGGRPETQWGTPAYNSGPLGEIMA